MLVVSAMKVSRVKLHINLEEFMFPTHDDDDDDDDGIVAAIMAPFSCSSLPATLEFSPDHRCGILQAFFTSRLS
jgi:hypothetical protein